MQTSGGDHNKASKRKSGNVRIRAMKASDIAFVQNLAGRTPGFSICPGYLLWALGKFQQDLCVIAEQKAVRKPLGYLLALPVGIRGEAVFVWQLVCTTRGRRMRAQIELVKHLRKVVIKRRIGEIMFTTIPGSSREVNVKALADRIFATVPTRVALVPAVISREEHVFRLRIKQ